MLKQKPNKQTIGNLYEMPKVAPSVNVIDGDVGGVGKSTLGVLLSMAHELVELPLDVFELDEQGKLRRFLGDGVISLHGAALEKDRDGDRDLLRTFAPFHGALVSMAQTGRSSILEVGGALTGVWNSFMEEIDLDEDLVALGISMTIFMVMVASPESIHQVVTQIMKLRHILPSAAIIVVLNERDGDVRVAAADVSPRLRARLDKILAAYPTLTVPRLSTKSRRLYERLGVRPAEIVGWQAGYYRDAISKTGMPLLEAKRFVKDVAAWAETVRAQMAELLPFLGGA